MWESIKNVLSNVQDVTGIEIPGLPADLGSADLSSIDLGAIGDSATTAVEGATDSATTAVEGVTDSAAQALPDIADGLIGGTER